jgi:hypothetical protein
MDIDQFLNRNSGSWARLMVPAAWIQPNLTS